MAVVVTAVLIGLLTPIRASAEISDGWDYRALTLGGTYKTVVGQFGGDLASDILFYGPGTAADSLWIGNADDRGTTGSNGFTKINLSIGGDFIPVVGDFGGDDYDDILFYGIGSAVDSLWIAVDTASYFDKTRKVSVGGAYQPKVLHDYRAVGAKDDILFLGPGTAKDYYWHFADRLTAPHLGPVTYTSRELNVNGTYQLVIGDYSGDRIEDVVLYQPGTASDYKWVSSAAGAFSQSGLTITGFYKPVTIFGEVRDSILWWGNGSASPRFWRSTGPTFQSVPIDPVDVAATVVSAGLEGAIIAVPGALPDARDTFFKESASSDFSALAGEIHDQTTARPLVGDFDNDDYIDVVWYGPDTQRDELWFSVSSSPGVGGLSGKSAAGAGHSTGVKATPIAPR